MIVYPVAKTFNALVRKPLLSPTYLINEGSIVRGKRQVHTMLCRVQSDAGTLILIDFIWRLPKTSGVRP